MKLQDQIVRILELEKTLKRIISLVPSLEDSIIGITKFCISLIHIKQTITIV